MDTALSKRDRSQLRYRYFVDFWHGISVFQGRNKVYFLPTDPTLRPLILILDPKIFAKLDPWFREFFDPWIQSGLD